MRKSSEATLIGVSLGLCQRPVASRRNLSAHEHDSISSRHEPSIVSPPTARVTRRPKNGGQDRLGQGGPDWLVSRPPQGHGPVRPMAHVARPSREQDLMQATRVGCSSPDGSPSFRGQFAPGDWRLGRPQRPNPRRTESSFKHLGGDRPRQTWGTFLSLGDARVSPGTRNVSIINNSATAT